jgi:membrane-bound lytic murein transglycosylase B
MMVDLEGPKRQQWTSRRARALAPPAGTTMRAPTTLRSGIRGSGPTSRDHHRPVDRLVAMVAAAAALVTLAAGLPAAPAWAQTGPDNPELPIPDIPTTAPTTTVADATTTTTVAPTTDPSAEPDPDVPPPVYDPRLSRELSAVQVESANYDASRAAYASAWRRQVDAQQRKAAAVTALADLAAAEQRLTSELNDNTRRHDKSAFRLQALRQGTRQLAVAAYVHGGTAGSAGLGLDPAEATDEESTRILVESLSDTQLNDIAVHAAIVDRTQAVIDVDTAALADVHLRQADETARRDQAEADRVAAVALVDRARRSVADDRMTARVTGTDLSLVALDAYWRASMVTRYVNSACRLKWTALAGIGRVESLHGTYGGGPLDGNGDTVAPIIGIALDGSRNTAVIRDTDGGSIDTDPVWDRAVGPMAFIPSSWRAYGRDGNRDGRNDVQNIYDAALASSVLLCRAAPLDNDANLRAAYYMYNRSDVYVDMVLGYTHGYDAFVIPPVPPETPETPATPAAPAPVEVPPA